MKPINREKDMLNKKEDKENNLWRIKKKILKQCIKQLNST